jgi:hypothetical protein
MFSFLCSSANFPTSIFLFCFAFPVVPRAVNPKSDNHEMVFFIPQRHENLAFKSERIAFSRLAESYTLRNGVTCYGFFKGHFDVSRLIYLQPVV